MTRSASNAKDWELTYAEGWGHAIAALRHAALNLAGWGEDLAAAADYLAAIGPDTGKYACDSCGKPTSMGCARCERRLCSRCGVVNTNTWQHPGGAVGPLQCRPPAART